MDDINIEYNKMIQESYKRSSADSINRIDIKKVRERAVKKEKERTKKILKIVIPVVIVVSTMTGAWLNNAYAQNKFNSDMIKASKQYEYIVEDNTHRTNDNSGYWFDDSQIGLAISELPENEKDLAIFSLVSKIRSSGGSISNADTVVKIVSDGQFEGFNDYAQTSFGVNPESKSFLDDYETALATVYNANQIQSGLNEEKMGGQR